MEGPGKFLMKHLWRFQQIGGLVSVTLMCLNLTIPLWEYTGWRFRYIGLGAKYNWLIIIILFSFVFGIALLSGFIYDRVFKLWTHKEVVNAERNPFSKGRINPKEMLSWQYFYIPLLLKQGLKAEAEFNLKWNERNMERDPQLRKDVYMIMDWVDKYKIKNYDERWLKYLNRITKEKYKKKFGKVKPDW